MQASQLAGARVNGALTDAWVLHLHDNTAAWRWERLEARGDAPGRLSSHAAVVVGDTVRPPQLGTLSILVIQVVYSLLGSYKMQNSKKTC